MELGRGKFKEFEQGRGEAAGQVLVDGLYSGVPSCAGVTWSSLCFRNISLPCGADSRAVGEGCPNAGV